MQIRIEPELKTEAEAILSRLGLKPTEYIRMALSQLVLRKGLPFDACIPNNDTIAALEEPAHNLRQFEGSPECHPLKNMVIINFTHVKISPILSVTT